jgi:hypothetical protein
MKNSSMMDAYASQNIQDDQAPWRREWIVWGRLFSTPSHKITNRASRDAGCPTTYPVTNSPQASTGEAIQATVTAGSNSWWQSPLFAVL